MSSIQEKYGAVMVVEGSRCLRTITGVCNHLVYVVILTAILLMRKNHEEQALNVRE